MVILMTPSDTSSTRHSLVSRFCQVAGSHSLFPTKILQSDKNRSRPQTTNPAYIILVSRPHWARVKMSEDLGYRLTQIQ